MSKLPDVQEAVRSVRGVAHATVRWPEMHGPAYLHVVLEGGAERERVLEDVLAVVRDEGGVDLTTVRVPPPPPPEELSLSSSEPPPAADPPRVGGGGAGLRAVFRALSVERDELDNKVTVTLRVGDRTLVGRAEGLATRRATPRTAAAAALLALREVLPDDVRMHVDWLDVAEPQGSRPALVHSAVTSLSQEGERTFFGSAIVRDDLREAAVRATLDALNRHLGRLTCVSASR